MSTSPTRSKSDSLPGLSRSDLMSIASARPLPLPLPSHPPHPVPYSVQRANAPFIVSESETSESSDASDGLETEIDDGGHAHPVHDLAARDAERGWGKEWKGPNATALREATQVVIAMRSSPVTFAAEYVALRKQVKDHADWIIKLQVYIDTLVDRVNGEGSEKSIEDLRKSVSGLLGRERV